MNTFDGCVVGYHLNPLTCGIAKFNSEFARRLQVPILNVFDPRVKEYAHSILSIKTAEFTLDDLGRLQAMYADPAFDQVVDLFLHDYTGTELEKMLLRKCRKVYCGNSELHERIMKEVGSAAVEVWCPGTLHGAVKFDDVEIKVFTFGMAHKIRADYYHKLDALLQATGRSYCLYLSTALHEGTTFENDFNDVFEEMQEAFDGPVYFMGFMSDTAVFNYLKNCTYFAAFFPKGLRANNTSVNTALSFGVPVITNLDDYSPSHLVHEANIIDINKCANLVTDEEVLRALSRNAQEAGEVLSWERLVETVGANSRSDRVRRSGHIRG